MRMPARYEPRRNDESIWMCMANYRLAPARCRIVDWPMLAGDNIAGIPANGCTISWIPPRGSARIPGIMHGNPRGDSKGYPADFGDIPGDLGIRSGFHFDR
jgi:hypothetical protein